MRSRSRTLCVLLLSGLSACVVLRPPAPSAERPAGDACVPVGGWIEPGAGGAINTPAVFDRLKEKRVVLLGESHDSAEDHRWQLQTIAALHARRASIVLGFEMFPRQAQAVLDRWVAGDLDEKAFLEESGWSGFWDYPPALYLPLFHFARMNRVPMRALSVDRMLVSRVAREGWQSVPNEEREGVSDPAPADPDYTQRLGEVYEAHRHGEPEEVATEAEQRRFTEAQLLWDRAFAEAIFTAAREDPEALVIGVMGTGHLEYRHGVPRQLADLGFDEQDVAVLLPWNVSQPCEELSADFADLVFGVEPPVETAAPRPRLGVLIGVAEGGVLVREVVADSVAEAAGIRVDDVVVEAAGRGLADPADLQAVVARQAPGTWLPLMVRRDGRTREIIARFPVAP